MKNPFPIPTNLHDRKNARATSRNRLGIRGVSYHKGSGRYRAKIGSKGLVYDLGYFDTPELARAAYVEAAQWLEMHDGEPFPDKEGQQ